MRVYKSTLRVRARAMYSRLKTTGYHLALAAGITTGLITTMPAGAQTQPAAPTGLTDDAQAIVLLQTLAKGQSAGAAAIPALQLQLLTQYLERANQSATTAAGMKLARAQMLGAQSQVPAAAGIVQPAALTGGGVPMTTAAAVLPQKKPGAVRIGIV